MKTAMKNAPEVLLNAARKHGSYEDVLYEVGDLQDLVREMWGLMNQAQRSKLLCSDVVRSMAEVIDAADEMPQSIDDVSEADMAAASEALASGTGAEVLLDDDIMAFVILSHLEKAASDDQQDAERNRG